TKLSRQPIAKLRSRKVRRFTNGLAEFRVRAANAAAVIRHKQRRPADTGEVHPWLGASLIAISSAASATAPSAREITSRWRASSKEACPFGTVTDAARAATAPGKTLIRKSQCHENVSVIQPPTTGPTVGARTANTPPIMVASV